MRFGLGFSHDRDEGPGFFTTDSGTVPDFPESYSYTTDAYRAGVDFHVLPRTTISYDQFFSYFKQDNAVLESPAATPQNYGYQLANGTPVDLGVVWSTLTPAEALPCAAPIANGATTPPTVSPNCNAFLSYSQVGLPPNSMPTERLRFQSNYFQKFQMNGLLSAYSSSDNSIPDFNEVLNGFTTRTATRESTTAGTGKSHASFRECGLVRSVRVHGQTPRSGFVPLRQLANPRPVGYCRNERLRRRLAQARLASRFRFHCLIKYPLRPPARLPRSAPRLPTIRPVARFTLPVPGADVTNELSYQFLGQNLKSNTLDFEYDFNRRLSGSIGYLYTNRTIAQFSATFDTGETYFPGGARHGRRFLSCRPGRLRRRRRVTPGWLHSESGWLDHRRLTRESCPGGG